MAGLKPNDFHWIIEGKLAVSECIGGGGLTPRKIRREEEIQWLKGQGINAIFSLLDSDFNLKNYQEVGFRTYHYPLSDDIPIESLNVIFDAIKEALADNELVFDETRKAMLEMGRGLRKHLEKKKKMVKTREKFELINDILPAIAEKSAKILDRTIPTL